MNRDALDALVDSHLARGGHVPGPITWGPATRREPDGMVRLLGAPGDEEAILVGGRPGAAPRIEDMVRLINIGRPATTDQPGAAVRDPDSRLTRTTCVEINEWHARGIALEAGNGVVTAAQLATFADRARTLLGNDAVIAITDDGYALRAETATSSTGRSPRLDWKR